MPNGLSGQRGLGFGCAINTDTKPGVLLHNKSMDLSTCVSEECEQVEGGGVYTTLMSNTLKPNGLSGTGTTSSSFVSRSWGKTSHLSSSVPAAFSSAFWRKNLFKVVPVVIVQTMFFSSKTFRRTLRNENQSFLFPVKDRSPVFSPTIFKVPEISRETLQNVEAGINQ